MGLFSSTKTTVTNTTQNTTNNSVDSANTVTATISPNIINSFDFSALVPGMQAQAAATVEAATISAKAQSNELALLVAAGFGAWYLMKGHRV